MEFVGPAIEIGKSISKPAGEWIGYVKDLDENMQKLKRKMEYLSGQVDDISTELSSAEHQPGKRRKTVVDIWLRDAQRMKDDVQGLEQEVVGGRKNFILRGQLGKRIVEKIEEVAELEEKRKGFKNLLIDVRPKSGLIIPPQKDFVESTEARNMERVWECLMDDTVRKIGVFGMGGVGKTTIMHHINNLLVKGPSNFDDVIWATVSKAFDIRKLQREIAKVLKCSLSDDEDETTRASKLLAELSQRKNYVLILDDLWKDFPLEKVGIPEPTNSNGCKLVLTTRSLEICTRMDCEPVKVELLTKQEAWNLFKSKAFSREIPLGVEEIAIKIAKKCACLPLVIVTVAGGLRGLNEISGWRNALNELISSTKDAEDDENVVFEQLKFSYTRLGNKVLQHCFLYCAFYPEDHKIPMEELIEYWIAEGLIVEMDSTEAMFDKGYAILQKLTSTCLLERSTNIKGVEYVKLHDSLRDMALTITRSSPRFMVKAGEGLEKVAYEDWSEDLEKVSLMHNRIHELPITPPNCPQLTTLLLGSNYLRVIPETFFMHMPRLKVLDLSRSHMKSLPESVSNLENLHALLIKGGFELNYVRSLEKLKALKVLKLTRSQIQELPGIEELVNLRELDLSDNHNLNYVRSLEKLKALKVLKLTGSRIQELPGIEELVNLRELDLSYNESLKTFPSRKLCSLSKLQFLRIGNTEVKVSAEELLCLRQLKVLGAHFHDAEELTRYATSQQCQGLEKYNLAVGRSFCGGGGEGKNVCINIGSELFQGEVDQLVLPSNMDSFILRRWHDLISLAAIPSLRDAKDLRRCVVFKCNGIESSFSSSLFSEDGQIPLRTIESLTFWDLPSFRVLFDGIVPPAIISFNLKELRIEGCPSIKSIFPAQLLRNFPNLKDLQVSKCENVEDIIIVEEEEVEMSSSSDRGHHHHQDSSNTITLPKLQYLFLWDLPRLKSIYKGRMVCESLEWIMVYKCPMVRRLPLSLHVDVDSHDHDQQPTPPPALKRIEGEEEWWESLEWDEDPRTKTILQPFFHRLQLRSIGLAMRELFSRW